MDEGIRQTVALLAVAMAVALAARRMKLPYTIGLVLVGALLAVAPGELGFELTPHLIFNLILPPLLFEGALNLHWRALKRDWPPILVLSVLGTIVSMVVVVAAMVWLLAWPLASALMFGALISATDPVAIIAMFKDNNLKGRLCLLVESESLFNDGAAAVLFIAALGWTQASGNAATTSDHLVTLARTVFGGLGVGAVVGGAAILTAGRTSDHLVEAGLTTIAAFASFLIAEKLHASGVLATVMAGLLIGNFGGSPTDDKGLFSPRAQEFVGAFWEFVAFLANSIIFLLIGRNIATAHYETYGVGVMAATIAIVLFARAATVYPLCLAFGRSRWAISAREQHVLWWGGLRGALGLALALSLPASLPLREEIVVVTFAVVAFSIVAQGLSMPPVLRRLGFLQSEVKSTSV